MRFRLGAALGFGVGYVLGAKAGQERYEQIRRTASGLWETNAAHRLRSTASRTAEQVQTQAATKLRNISHRGRRTIDVTEQDGVAETWQPAGGVG